MNHIGPETIQGFFTLRMAFAPMLDLLGGFASMRQVDWRANGKALAPSRINCTASAAASPARSPS